MPSDKTVGWLLLAVTVWSLGVTGSWGFQRSVLEGDELQRWLVIGPASLGLAIFVFVVRPIGRVRGSARSKDTRASHSVIELAGSVAGRGWPDPLLRLRRSQRLAWMLVLLIAVAVVSWFAIAPLSR